MERDRVSGTLQGLCKCFSIQSFTVRPPRHPFWDSVSPNIDIGIHTKVKGIDIHIKWELAIQEINTKWNITLLMYTDGSVDEFGKVGCSLVIPYFKRCSD